MTVVEAAAVHQGSQQDLYFSRSEFDAHEAQFQGLAPDGLHAQVAQGAVGAVLEFHGNEPVALAAAYEVAHFGTYVQGQVNNAVRAVAAFRKGRP